MDPRFHPAIPAKSPDPSACPAAGRRQPGRDLPRPGGQARLQVDDLREVVETEAESDDRDAGHQLDKLAPEEHRAEGYQKHNSQEAILGHRLTSFPRSSGLSPVFFSGKFIERCSNRLSIINIGKCVTQ